MTDVVDRDTGSTTIDAGLVVPVVARIIGGLGPPAFAPRLDVAALRRWDVRRPPRRIRGCRIRPITVGRAGGARVLVAELTPPRPVGPPGRTLVYLHGGAYVAGPLRSQWYLAAVLCRALGVRTLFPLYRRAPEHPFPAAFEDVTIVLESLAGRAVGPVLLAGDSAGGGLAAAVAAHRDDIAALAVVSPWLDLALDAEDVDDSRDVILAVPGLREAARLYAGGHDLSDPRLSPLHAGLAGLPPTMVQVGTDEVFLSDVRRFTTRARAAGAHIHHVEGRGLPHDWSLIPLAPEAAAARRLLAEHLSP